MTIINMTGGGSSGKGLGELALKGIVCDGVRNGPVSLKEVPYPESASNLDGTHCYKYSGSVLTIYELTKNGWSVLVLTSEITENIVPFGKYNGRVYFRNNDCSNCYALSLIQGTTVDMIPVDNTLVADLDDIYPSDMPVALKPEGNSVRAYTFSFATMSWSDAGVMTIDDPALGSQSLKYVCQGKYIITGIRYRDESQSLMYRVRIFIGDITKSADGVIPTASSDGFSGSQSSSSYPTFYSIKTLADNMVYFTFTNSRYVVRTGDGFGYILGVGSSGSFTFNPITDKIWKMVNKYVNNRCTIYINDNSRTASIDVTSLNVNVGLVAEEAESSNEYMYAVDDDVGRVKWGSIANTLNYP